ncbi:putative LPS assembly protein LptD [Flavobacterium sp. SUN046]|uniref:putative LPS assembly protein LptD n=1 Tax=Flavobacterium sp. SUN046 TaxID=3002440 RepID=UPI002DBB0A22|nr:putative LPS assembly protein LptD [Flavobacterium sp. SUN046]MEC4049028.1 putative LPS assembly protein LptD [Flavobacterium sp. SUN046]
MRTNLFYILLSAIFLTIGNHNSYAQALEKGNKAIPSKSQDSKKPTNDLKTDNKEALVLTKQDLKDKDTVKKSSATLEGKVKHKAKDYSRFDPKKKILTLYNQAELYYLDYELKAGIIVFDYAKNEVYAGRLKDSTGKYTQLPVFKQGSSVIEPDSIRFNYKTKKALVWNSRTTQGELNVKAGISKKENDSVYYMRGAKITTAKDLEDPEYYFYTRYAKFVPGKKVIVGPTNMYIANVPTPIFLPFAFFPITEKSRSGVIIPAYGQSVQRGYALQNGGYYFALSKNYDLAILGDYYTNGSYATRFETSYAQKYHFSGSANFRYENIINSERGYPDYSRSNIYNIQWTHTKDAKSNPNQRFSASVNLGSSKYFQQSVNQSNIGSSMNNTLSSSVSFSKTFNTVPIVNMSLTATHSQNTQTQAINMTLPTLQASVDRVFPFAPKDGIKKGFFKNINLQYNVKGSNQIQTTDSLFFKKAMFNNARTGFQHTIPLGTNFKIFKYFSASTNINYNEVWTLNTISKNIDFSSASTPVVTTQVKGFDSFRTYSFSNSIGTTIYGNFKFKGKRLKAIRHVIRPTITHSYTPSFEKYYTTYATNIAGTTFAEYSRFEGSIGTPNKNFSNSVGFNISNIFEAKVTDKDSTKTELKKVMLLNNLNFGANYDFATNRWSTISISGGTQFLKQKMNVNFNGVIDPYYYESGDFHRNAFSLSTGNLTMNYAFAVGGEKEKKNTQGAKNGGREDDLFGTNTDLNDSRNQVNKDKESDKFSGFYNSKLPLDMNMAFSVSYNNLSNHNNISSCSLMLSANTNLTPKWKIGASSGYDFVNKGVTFTQIRMNRDLMSWNMTFNWTPFGRNAYWGFFIGIKAGVLSDIKWDKRTQPDRTLK